MFPFSPLKELQRRKLTKKKLPKAIGDDAIKRLDDYLTKTADTIAEEASNGSYHKVTALDIDRGIELLQMRAVRDYLKDKDSLASVYGEVDMKVKLIERGAR